MPQEDPSTASSFVSTFRKNKSRDDPLSIESEFIDKLQSVQQDVSTAQSNDLSFGFASTPINDNTSLSDGTNGSIESYFDLRGVVITFSSSFSSSGDEPDDHSSSVSSIGSNGYEGTLRPIIKSLGTGMFPPPDQTTNDTVIHSIEEDSFPSCSTLEEPKSPRVWQLSKRLMAEFQPRQRQAKQLVRTSFLSLLLLGASVSAALWIPRGQQQHVRPFEPKLHSSSNITYSVMPRHLYTRTSTGEVFE
eukprot:scaffold6968_cov91-Cylindrotheca_fusiformis.AAC.2